MKKVAGRGASLIQSRQPEPPLKAAVGTNSITKATRASSTSSGQNKYVPSAPILIDHKLNSMAALQCHFQSTLSGTLTEPTSASGGGRNICLFQTRNETTGLKVCILNNQWCKSQVFSLLTRRWLTLSCVSFCL